MATKNVNLPGYKDDVNSSPSSTPSIGVQLASTHLDGSRSLVPTTSLIDQLAWSLSTSPPMNIFMFVKLNKNNYMIWKDQFLTYITAYDLECIMDFSLHVPSKFIGTSINPTFSNWSWLYSIMKGWIYSSNFVSMLSYLCSGMTTIDQWVSLEESNYADIQSKAMDLRQKHQGFRKDSLNSS